MRAERLVALLFLLQQRRRATAAELAEALEVSERTVYRDVDALLAAGVPLWTEQGRAGGIRLLDGWRTKLDGLTGREAAAILAVGVPDVLAELGLGSALTAARAKVLAGLPAELRDYAERISEKFLLDAPGWFHRAEETSQLAAVADAVAGERRLRVRYQRADRAVDRELDPLGLVVKAGVWYLVARPVDAEDLRTYRVARLMSAEPTEEHFTRPADFNLVTWWDRASAQFERSLLRYRVRLRLNRIGLRRLRDVTDQDAALEAIANAGPPDADGWREVEFSMESMVVAASQLSGLGAGVEVLDPPELRATLAEIAQTMAARNAMP